jgi:hypothetical protein
MFFEFLSGWNHRVQAASLKLQAACWNGLPPTVSPALAFESPGLRLTAYGLKLYGDFK